MRIARFVGLGLLAASVMLGQPPTAKAVPIPSDVRVHKNLHYGGHAQQVMDIYVPPNPAPRPAMIVIHGGGWTDGSKEDMVTHWVLPYLEKGFVVANMNYRLVAQATAPAAVEDALDAADFVYDNAKKYGIDQRRIAITGESAGAHLALMVGLTPKKWGKPSKVRAVINFYGITDVDALLHPPTVRDFAEAWVPAGPNRTELAKRVSPIAYARKDVVPPILTIHGDADPVVPYEQGVKLTKALTDAGAKTEMISIPKGGHGGFPPSVMMDLQMKIVAFLKASGIM